MERESRLRYRGGISFAVTGDHDNRPTDMTNLVVLKIPLENHPADSRVQIMKDDMCQTLSSRMGTGGGNVPLIMEITVERNNITGNLPSTEQRGNMYDSQSERLQRPPLYSGDEK